MKLSVVEIAEFCKDKMEETFNEEFDIINDNLIDKVLLILFDGFEIDYSFIDKFTAIVLENIKSLNLKNIQKDDAGNIIEDLSPELCDRIKQLIALYCLSSYNQIRRMVKENDLEEILKRLNEQEQ